MLAQESLAYIINRQKMENIVNVNFFFPTNEYNLNIPLHYLQM